MASKESSSSGVCKGRLHFLGIAGAAMSGLAAALVQLGYEVTGTDPGAYPPASDWLDAQGIRWWRKPDPAHVEEVDTVIISSGTPADDVEVVAAGKHRIPVVPYAEFLGELAANKRRIVVAGTHGKTTTTSLIAWLLETAGQSPDFLVGITPRNFTASVRLSDTPLIVLEGDEYKASSMDSRSKFMYYRPDVLVATSLELDHPDVFPDVAAVRERFNELINGMPDDGRLLYAADASELAAIAKAATVPHEAYGEGGDWQPAGVRFEPTGIAFDLHHNGKYAGHFAAPLYGRHNVANVTAAVAVALREGVNAETIQQGLAGFLGASRRFQVVSAPDAAVTVIDDYAHHPTEIATTIEAAKLHFGRRVLAVVRPHTYSRVQKLLAEYRQALAGADRAFVAEIEGAREKTAAATVSGGDVAEDAGSHVVYEPDRTHLVQAVVRAAKPGDIIISMTVGGYDGLAAELADRMKQLKS